MSDTPSLSRGYCKVCLIRYGEGDPPHEDLTDCVAALRAALENSSERARSVAFAVSTRLMGILEELIHQPEAGGVHYFTMEDDEKGEVRKKMIPANQVSGIFAALLSMYERMGDWSPYQAEKDRANDMQAIAARLLTRLEAIETLAIAHGDDQIVSQVRSALDSIPQPELSVLQSAADPH